jgi:predicted RNase H-like HicB family nuclease
MKEGEMVYRIVIEKGEDFGYVAHCPAIPGCHSQGNTIEEAIENIKDAIRGCLSALDEDLISNQKELASIEIAV